MEALVPLLVALSGLPALGVAAWYARDAADAHVRGIALRWALIALALLLGACGLYWAAGHQLRTGAVVLALVLAVNVLGVSLVMHLRRRDRGRQG
ncbi:hypothetical protein [Pseudoxanthomonas koreensis]|uniref:hypothetical protein n=1 Tax=Pseudoxanthomonas koreensis TaxID=266061 RepID=UPI0035A73E07